MMRVKHYQYINSLDSGDIHYEDYLIDYFKVDRTQSYKDVIRDLNEKMFIKIEDYNGQSVKVGTKTYMAEKDFYDCSYEQFILLDRLLVEDKNVENLHKLIAIYCRPRVFNPLKLRYEIEPFNIKRHESISDHIKENMKMEDAHAIMIFFSIHANESMKNINIYCLNQQKKKDRP